MYAYQPKKTACPYCGEIIELLIDCSVDEQRYIEDCQVCCRPITINVSIENGDPQLSTFDENDTF
ncbi:Cysteine-rich CPXCG [Alteromonadaceae bacterium Bs31]|nr:Cysteine-rich CPXCG [Alteromonadaceae bacterium Bs31]